MKKYVNGKYIEMTAEEIAELKKMQEDAELIEVAPTTEERLDAMESALLELAGAIYND